MMVTFIRLEILKSILKGHFGKRGPLTKSPVTSEWDYWNKGVTVTG